MGGQQPPEQVADIVYRGVYRRKDLLALTLVPALYERIMARQLKSELEG